MSAYSQKMKTAKLLYECVGGRNIKPPLLGNSVKFYVKLKRLYFHSIIFRLFLRNVVSEFQGRDYTKLYKLFYFNHIKLVYRYYKLLYIYLFFLRRLS